MRYRDKPELLDKLAAEYVLSTLRGRARRRFQAWMREDLALRHRVDDWNERLFPMTDAIEERQPPGRVWAVIQDRLAAGRAAPRTPWWNSVGFWRSWGLFASGVAAALMVGLNVGWLAGSDTAQNLPSAQAMQPSYIAVLRTMDNGVPSPDGKMVFMAYAARRSDQLWVKRIALDDRTSEQVYELWAMPAKSGEAPRSLGVIPASEKGTMPMRAMADEALKDVPQLAISVEPAGGSPTGLPSGPVIAMGDCHRFW